MGEYETILYDVDGPIATITLNRPEALNTIVPPMPDEVQTAVDEAIRDAGVEVDEPCREADGGPASTRAMTSAAASTRGTSSRPSDGDEATRARHFVRGHRPGAGPDAEVHGGSSAPPSRDRPGPRLVRRRRQRLRPAGRSDPPADASQLYPTRRIGACPSGISVSDASGVDKREGVLPLKERRSLASKRAGVQLINEAVPFAEVKPSNIVLRSRRACRPQHCRGPLAAMKLPMVDQAYAPNMRPWQLAPDRPASRRLRPGATMHHGSPASGPSRARRERGRRALSIASLSLPTTDADRTQRAGRAHRPRHSDARSQP